MVVVAAAAVVDGETETTSTPTAIRDRHPIIRLRRTKEFGARIS